MGKGNETNLISGETYKDKEKARLAGIKSGEVRRNKRKITDYLRILLEAEMTLRYKDELGNETNIKAQGAEHIAKVLMKKALSGDIRAIKEYIDRIEGQAVQKTQITNDEGENIKSLEINFVSNKENE